jgi:hypothetical protein
VASGSPHDPTIAQPADELRQHLSVMIVMMMMMIVMMMMMNDDDGWMVQIVTQLASTSPEVVQENWRNGLPCARQHSTWL